MLIFENIAIAINGLLSNKMRALLTMLGIIIGISSVIAIVTVGNSMTQGLSEEMQGFGAGNIDAYLTQKPQEITEEDTANDPYGYTVWYSPEEKDLLSMDMLEKFKSDFTDRVKYVSVQEHGDASSAKNGKNSGKIQLMGVNTDYLYANNVSLLTGRMFTQKDFSERRQITIISDTLAKKLFPGEDPIGKTLDMTISNTVLSFYVVGVYENKSSGPMMGMGGVDIPTNLYLPYTIVKSTKSWGNEGFQNFTITGEVGVDTNSLINEINTYFANIYAKNKNFHVECYSMQDMVDSMKSMFDTISLAISAIASISLLVGGIGVMNIMLVSIIERTREIGTRKALGATNGSIRLQFIVESVIICLVGGIIGIGLGFALGGVGAKLVGYAAQPSLTVGILAAIFSMVIGVFFGYYPANKAAKLDPIEALRYE